MNMNDDEHKDRGFLSRWSQRKVQVRQGVPPAVALPAAPIAPAAADVAPPAAKALWAEGDGTNHSRQVAAAPALADTPAPADARPLGPTLQDVEALTPESDYSRFVARDVDPLVKNSAMKKLFTDPHYNVMDRLDTYIDDYNTPDPIPKAMFRQLVQARMLGLLDDELEDQDLAATGKPVTAPTPPGGGTEAEAAADVADVASAAGAADDASAMDAVEPADVAVHNAEPGQPPGAVDPALLADASVLLDGVQAAGPGQQVNPLAAG
jgi:hypothetical protein